MEMVVDGRSLTGHLNIVHIVVPFFTIIVGLGGFLVYRFLIDDEDVIVDMCWVNVLDIVRKVFEHVVNGCCRSVAIECFDRIRHYDADHTPGVDDFVEFNQGFHGVRSVFDDVRSDYVIQGVGDNR